MRTPLYCQRKLLPEYSNLLYIWCKQNGIENIHDPEEFHLTVAYSKEPVIWERIVPDIKKVLLKSDGKRSLAVLGTTLVLALEPDSSYLLKRFNYYTANGCSWDFPSYIPHISLASDYKDVPAIHPYAGDIVLGPEEMSELQEGYKPTIAASAIDSVDNIIEAIVKPSFIDGVKAVAKENKVRVEDINTLDNSVSLRYKNMTFIVRPDTVAFLLFLNNSEVLDMNAPSFANIPTPKTVRGIGGMLKKYKTRYDKLVEDISTMTKLNAQIDKIKNSLKVNGLIDKMESQGDSDEF